MNRIVRCLVLAGMLAAPPSFAGPGDPSACIHIETDADRLACYDAAMGRRAADPADADARA